MTASPGPLRAPITIALVSATFWFAWLVSMALMVPTYERKFADYGVALPWHTAATIDVSHWLLGRNPGQGVPGAAMVTGAAAVVYFLLCALAVRPGARRPALGVLVASAALGLVANLLVALAIYVPYVRVLDALKAG